MTNKKNTRKNYKTTTNESIKKNIGNNTRKNRVFKKKDFISGDGMLTTAWGPAAWHFLHMISFNYPIHPTNENKKHYMEMIKNLQYVLPCKYCRINLTNNFKKKPITLSDMKNRDSFSRYVYDLHETVNKMLKKKSGLTYCDVRERYEHFRARCVDEKPKVFNFKKTMKKRQKENEKGCVEPLYGKKSKCVIHIVPQEDKIATFNMDKKCIKSR